MRILHVGAAGSPHTVNGIDAVIWTVAAQQARLGHEVGLLIDSQADSHARATAAGAGLQLINVPLSFGRYDPARIDALLDARPPDLVHMHSVFIPRQALLAQRLVRASVPYVITPHGGVMPQVLRHSRLKKLLYSLAVEKRRFLNAAAIGYVVPGGEVDIRRFVPGFRGPVRWVSNPVEQGVLDGFSWSGDTDDPNLVYLGRFAVYHKGLDLLAEIARRIPQARFDLYGVEFETTRRQLQQLIEHRPANLSFNPPVYDDAKARRLAAATMYIQVSRWEALSISILEALYLGIPCVISSTMSMAGMFREHELGLVVDPDPESAAHEITNALRDPARLQAWSANASAYARRNFTAQAVAETLIDLYAEALTGQQAVTHGMTKGKTRQRRVST